MTYLIDTDRVVDYLKGRPEAIELLQGLGEDGLSISVITLGELLDGIYYGTDPLRHLRGFRDFLEFVAVVNVDESIMARFARLRGQMRQSGQSIGDFDLIIAATALEHDLTLVTRNLRHFTRIPRRILFDEPG